MEKYKRIPSVVDSHCRRYDLVDRGCIAPRIEYICTYEPSRGIFYGSIAVSPKDAHGSLS